MKKKNLSNQKTATTTKKHRHNFFGYQQQNKLRAPLRDNQNDINNIKN